MNLKGVYFTVGIVLLFFCTSFVKIKGDRELPPATHTGENIMACKVNGMVVIAAENGEDLAGAAAVKFSPSKANELVYIGGIFVSPRYDIEISFRYNDTLGTYPIIDKYPYFGYFWDYTKSVSPNDSNQFSPDNTHIGTVTVSYNDGNIIAGTFAFDAVNRKGKVVHVTEGRFDILKH